MKRIALVAAVIALAACTKKDEAPVDTGAAMAPAPAAQTAAAPLKDVLTVCEPPEKGVATCYEIPPKGSLCRKVYYQGGEVTWRDARNRP